MSDENQNTNPENSEEDQETEELEQDESQGGESEEVEEDSNDFDRDRALRKLKKLNSENRNLRQAKKDAEDKASAAEGKTEQMKVLEAKNSRYETLADNDLPLKLAKFISATDPEEILEQAEELLSLGGGSGKPPSDQPNEKRNSRRGNPPQLDELRDPDEFASKIYSN